MISRVKIFDTTLRDGEQTPGVNLNIHEKLEIARQLAKLGVDVIEAGFAIASPGDFEAVSAVASNVKGVTVASLCRAVKRHRCGMGCCKSSRTTKDSYFYCYFRYTHEI